MVKLRFAKPRIRVQFPSFRMFFQELNFFVQGWRGFLVGQPRGWHAHHRGEAQGHREGWILPRETLQVSQLRRATSLTVELLARGGRVWGFGFGEGTQTAGFVWWGRATPGVLSNSFFSRVRRLPAVQQLRRLILLRPRRRKVRPRVERRSRRVGLSRRGGTLGLWLGRAHLISRVLRFRFWRYHLGRVFKAQTRGLLFPDLIDRACATRPGMRPRSCPGPRVFCSRGGGWRLWSPRKVILSFQKQITRAHQRRVLRSTLSSSTKKVLGFTSSLNFSFNKDQTFFSPRFYRGHLRGGRRRQPRLKNRSRWGTLPQGLPTVVLLGGSAGQTLHREVTRGGTPLILVGEIEIVPSVGSLYPVWWNNLSLEGPRHLWSHTEGLAHRSNLFRLFWNRLACLAEW